MTNNTLSDFITSPVGEIKFLALKHKVSGNMNNTGEPVYTIKLAFDGTSPEDKAFKAAIEEVNPKILGVKHAPAGGYTVLAKTYFDVKVLDAEGNTIEHEDLPVFITGSTGTARMIVKPCHKSELGGLINLICVQILTLDLVERAVPEGPSLVDSLKVALAKSSNGADKNA